MQGIRQQFVDAFLTACNVEIFNAGEEILVRGCISTDLYLLVAGTAELSKKTAASIEQMHAQIANGTSVGGDEAPGPGKVSELRGGDFVNAISFFTDSPQFETVKTKTICKVLCLPRANYKILVEDHPGSIGKLLQNLLNIVEEKATTLGASSKDVDLPKRLAVLKAGSVYDDMEGSNNEDMERSIREIEAGTSLTAVRDLVAMHLNKMKDDHTTRFLFAASRGDLDTIALMCEQGFDPNSADYDARVALHVASMKGNAEACQRLLDYGADPNLTDMHGASALYEAARNGHEDCMEVLLNHGAKLNMSEADAASRACQAVFEGDMLTLRRLLKAGLPVNAGKLNLTS